MEKTLATFVAISALSAALGWPAQSAADGAFAVAGRPRAALVMGAEALPLVLISDHDDREHDDDDDEEDDDDDEDDDACEDDHPCAATTAPDRSGTLPPPRNGLFGTGAAPQAKVN